MKKVVIAGAGIAGLSLAFALNRRGIDVDVFEKHERAGGNIRTVNLDGYLCEWGPNGFLDNVPETFSLVEALGLSGRIVRSSDAARRRFIYRNGRLHEVPMGPIAFLRSGLLSLRGKLRLAAEPWAAKSPGGDETIYHFAARRIGKEAAAVMVDPMVSGIFAGNARELSLRACFAKMADMEAQYGGLFKALIAKQREAGARKRERGIDVGPTGTLTSFVGGTQDLIDALVEKLGRSLHLSCGVTGLARTGRAWRVQTSAATVEADAVVLAGPAGVSADLIKSFSYGIAKTLRTIEGAPLAVVCLGYDEAEVERTRGPLNGFGFLVPRREDLRVLGALWDSSVYPHRAPEGRALIRVMIGGACDRGVLTLSDEALIDTARADLRKAMNLTVEPMFTRVIRHPMGIPQYTVGHLDRLAEIDRRLAAWPGLFLAGNAYRGPSINACIADADRVADAVAAHLQPAAKPELIEVAT
jgi:oxygen-dependent protoporphyrinogen oxidase